MVGRATLRQGRNRTFALVDLLEAKPHLKPLVRSIIADPTEFAPFPLLHILPNLFEIEFRVRLLSPVNITLHPSSLVCFQRFGTRIESLHLSGLSFPNYLSFARVLLAFTNLRHLTCTSVAIETAGGGAPLTVLKRRLSEQMQLKTLTVDYLAPMRGATVRPFLFSPGLAPSTVEKLRIAARIGPDAFESNLPGWSRLRSLVLRFHHGGRTLTGVVKLLEEFQSPELREVVLELEPATSIPAVLRNLKSFNTDAQPAQDVLKELEHRLLRFSHLSMTWVSPPLRRRALWACELSKHFPVLSQRGVLILKSEPAFPPGHDGAVHALVVSPDSTWIASGSEDCTIILWDTNGKITRQWVPHGYEPVRSLAFSPDGRYLVSGADDGKLIVWELSASGDARQVAVLEGHSGGVTSCACSPDGTLIASGSLDATVRLWDAATFLERRVLDGWPTPEVPSLAFSPDGRCLAGGSSSGVCCVWDIACDSVLHKSVHGERHVNDDDNYYSGPESDPAARHPFTLGNTQLATASGPGVIEVWGVYSEKEKGGRLFALEHLRRVNDVSFSPDGRLLVAAVGNGTVTVWDAHSGTELSVFEGHKDGVMKVCFSPCGKYIASASWDETVRVWRTGDGSCVATCPEFNHVVTRCITFSPDGQLLVSGARNGTVIIRKMKDLVPVDI
ncbi:transporter [Ganoderma sinense ZZ0214-1]|uniref:Transporter n=1 Tax=Ganoderma sinense ZZ0214-1 TaxID=1077348 RepID=A0A2G8SPW8_9APHY|nr:transporter [Ganoderma sinense ZZ0214-1]